MPIDPRTRFSFLEGTLRNITEDIREYADHVLAGFTIDSGTIRTVLKATEGTTPHTQTVARVMSFLDRLVKDHVRTVTRRRTKRLVSPKSLSRDLPVLPISHSSVVTMTGREMIRHWSQSQAL